MASLGSVPTGSRSTMKWISTTLSVVLTTSPAPSHPSTEMIEEVFASMATHAPELGECRKVIVCDGYTEACASTTPNIPTARKSRRLTAKGVAAYKEYVQAVINLCATCPNFRNTSVLVLDELHGCGLAVMAGLAVWPDTTPYVLVAQHDRVLNAPLDIPVLLRAMMSARQLRYVGLMSPHQMHYKEKSRLSYRSSLEPFHCFGLEFIPMLKYLGVYLLHVDHRYTKCAADRVTWHHSLCRLASCGHNGFVRADCQFRVRAHPRFC